MATTRKTSTPRKTAASARPVKKPTKKATSRKTKTTRVDIYPNRMTYAVSAAAGSILVLIAIIIAYS